MSLYRVGRDTGWYLPGPHSRTSQRHTLLPDRGSTRVVTTMKTTSLLIGATFPVFQPVFALRNSHESASYQLWFIRPHVFTSPAHIPKSAEVPCSLMTGRTPSQEEPDLMFQSIPTPPDSRNGEKVYLKNHSSLLLLSHTLPSDRSTSVLATGSRQWAALFQL